MMLTPEQLSYWAGVFDSKAYINMRTRKDSAIRSPYFVIKSADKEFMQLATLTFDGTIREMKANSSSKSTIWIWERTANSAREIILKLAPYMQRNKAVVREVLAWRTQSGKRYTPMIFPPIAIAVKGSAMSGSD